MVTFRTNNPIVRRSVHMLAAPIHANTSVQLDRHRTGSDHHFFLDCRHISELGPSFFHSSFDMLSLQVGQSASLLKAEQLDCVLFCRSKTKKKRYKKGAKKNGHMLASKIDVDWHSNAVIEQIHAVTHPLGQKPNVFLPSHAKFQLMANNTEH